MNKLLFLFCICLFSCRTYYVVTTEDVWLNHDSTDNFNRFGIMRVDSLHAVTKERAIRRALKYRLYSNDDSTRLLYVQTKDALKSF